MKKLLTLAIVMLFSTTLSFSQRLGYVDTDYIMGKIPEYAAAQEEIDRISQKWQEELEAMYQDVERMYEEYQQGEVLMPEDLKREKQEEIFQAERDAKEFREKKFGYNGELFALQESKVKPIQEKVFRAVETVSKRKRYDFVYDKAGEVTWLYTNAAYDISNDVLEELGYNTQEK